jgi:hypothetical protein
MAWPIKRELISAAILMALVLSAEWAFGIGWFGPWPS